MAFLNIPDKNPYEVDDRYNNYNKRPEDHGYNCEVITISDPGETQYRMERFMQDMNRRYGEKFQYLNTTSFVTPTSYVILVFYRTDRPKRQTMV